MPKQINRFAAAILTGLLIVLTVIGGTWLVVMNREPQTRPIEEALWVCDWNITKIYGPGTQEQASVVEQFRSVGLTDLKFTAPILYRMGGPKAGDPREGILMNPFDPRHPETALALAPSKRQVTESNMGGKDRRDEGEKPSN